MDEFLIKKLHKKLRYWGFLHLPLAGKTVVVNSILASTFWFFLLMFGKGLKSL